MLGKTLLGFTIVCNFATLLGLWVSYQMAPSPLQERVGHVLLFSGAIASLSGYIVFAIWVMRPLAHQKKDRVQQSDRTDWRTLYVKANDANTKCQIDLSAITNERDQLKQAVVQIQASQRPLPPHPIPELRLKILETCTELQAFIGKYGDHVLTTRRPEESVHQYTARLSSPVFKETRTKFTSDYRLNHEQSVLQLRNEMGARATTYDEQLDKALEDSKRGPMGAADSLGIIIERFWISALKVNC